MPATASRSTARHLDAEVQEDALNLRLAGHGYVYIATVLDLGVGTQGTNAAMYAAGVACERRYGSRQAIRRHTRQTAQSVTAAAHGSTFDPSDSNMLFLNRRFGIELEFNRPARSWDSTLREQIVALMIARGVNARIENYNHNTPSVWKMTTDATVTGGELVSPILSGADGFRQFSVAMNAIKECGGVVARNTGGHVHHDVNDFTAPQLLTLINNLEAAQDAVLAYVPTHRFNGTNGCGATKLTHDEFVALRAAVTYGSLIPRGSARGRSGLGVSRYRAFNFNSTLTYGTVEFRAHGGCLTPFMMRCWVAVSQAVIAFSKDGHRFDTINGEPVEVRAMLDTLVAAGYLRAEMRTRFIKRVTAVAESEGRRAA